jgi:CheY-like chemotaxis protein
VLIPIIAITAGTGVEINEKCIAAGMNDYIKTNKEGNRRCFS